MAPIRATKTKMSPSNATSTRREQSGTRSPARTPIASPSKRAAPTMGITAGQKQALIDNLQLEVTERARKLRAQYALQAQSLKTRIEMRINRIPSNLRKMNMGNLLAKYLQMETATSTERPAPPHQITRGLQGDETTTAAQTQTQTLNSQIPSTKTTTMTTVRPLPRGTKRPSDAFTATYSDKENTNNSSTPLPSKKQKRTVPPNQPTTILSPKSANARRSPNKHQTGVGHTTRPTSPLKSKPNPATTTTTTTTSSRAPKSMAPPPPPPASQAGKAPRGRKPATIDDSASNARTVSSASNASTGTTIVKNSTSTTKTNNIDNAGIKVAAPASKAGAKTTVGAKGGKKGGMKGTIAPAVAAGVDEAAAKGVKSGRRVLRKR